jgi:hypothetical protein
LAGYRRDPSFSAKVGFVLVFTVELAFPNQELLPQEILSGPKCRQEKKFSVGPIDDDDDDDDDGNDI